MKPPVHAKLADFCQTALQYDRAEGVERHLASLPEDVVPFCSNDYFALSKDSRIVQAAADSLFRYGLGAQAARLISGNFPPHVALEHTLAEWKKTAATLLFPSGYMAALGAITALCDENVHVVLDKRCHACLMDGARLSGARRHIFAHNDVTYLEDLLKKIRLKHAGPIAVVVESLYSMDGDFAPLKEIARLRETFGFWLFVDEAHATGLYGPERSGKIEELGLQKSVDVQMGTLGKSIGAAGGFIAASQEIIQLLLNRARTFLFTTGQPPLIAAASLEALRIIRSPEGEQLQKKLFHNIALLHEKLNDIPAARLVPESPILPFIVGDEKKASTAASHLAGQGFFVPAVRYPTVPKGKARLRITLNSAAEPAHIEKLGELLRKLIS